MKARLTDLASPSPPKPSRARTSLFTDDGSSGEGFTVFDIFIAQTSVHPECDEDTLSTQCENRTELGEFEAIGCVQRTEPWVLEILNTTRAPTAMSLLGKGGNVKNFEFKNKTLVHTIESGDGHDYVHNLNSTGRFFDYTMRYADSSALWVLDVASTEHAGLLTHPSPLMQTQENPDEENGRLSVELFERFRGATSARTLLTIMAGSGKVAAHRYYPKQIAYANIQTVPMVVLLAILCLAGVAGSLCIPVLPDGFPERGFDVFSWLASVKGDGLEVVERKSAGKDGQFAVKEVTWRSRMTAKEVEEEFGFARVKYRPSV